MAKKVSPAIIDKLRGVINDGFKEYDGDIREEALELLADVELIYKTAIENFDEQAKDVDELIKENETIKKHSQESAEVVLELDRRIKDQERTIADLNKSLNSISRSRYIIEHGTGSMTINVKPGSAILWEELAKTIEQSTKTVPLQNIIAAINNISPRF